MKSHDRRYQSVNTKVTALLLEPPSPDCFMNDPISLSLLPICSNTLTATPHKYSQNRNSYDHYECVCMMLKEFN